MYDSLKSLNSSLRGFFFLPSWGHRILERVSKYRRPLPTPRENDQTLINIRVIDLELGASLVELLLPLRRIEVSLATSILAVLKASNVCHLASRVQPLKKLSDCEF